MEKPPASLKPTGKLGEESNVVLTDLRVGLKMVRKPGAEAAGADVRVEALPGAAAC